MRWPGNARCRNGAVVGAEAVVVLEARTRARFVPVTVWQVRPETADAVALVLDVPPERAELFTYRAGQFITVRVQIDGAEHLRSYSMSSVPGLDGDLRITIKRTPGGLVSNWLNDHVAEGDQIEVTLPAGDFVLDDPDGNVVAFAAGSGITPVFSILHSVLVRGSGRASLLYANRDRA